MSKNPLVGCVSSHDFAAQIGVSVALVGKMRTSGMIPADAVVKNGRSTYVHVAKAKAALKVAPVGLRGAAPKWATAVGNKAGIARLKEIAKKQAEAGSAKTDSAKAA